MGTIIVSSLPQKVLPMEFVAIALLIVILIFLYLQFKNFYKNQTLSNKIEETDKIDYGQKSELITNLIRDSSVENKQSEANIQAFQNENILLVQDISKLKKQIYSLELERNEAAKSINQIQLHNNCLEKRIKELEANQKALIEELSGAVGQEDLEYATWDLVLQTTKLLVKERDEAIKQNKSLTTQNSQLVKSINHLKDQITTKESEINSLQQKLAITESEIYVNV